MGTDLDDTQYSRGELINDYWSNLYTIKSLPEEDQLEYSQEFFNRLVSKGMIDANQFSNIPSSILEMAQVFSNLPKRFTRKDIPELREIITESASLYKAKNYKWRIGQGLRLLLP